MIQIGLNCSPQQPIARRSWGSTSLRYKHALSSASLLGGSPLTLAFPSCSPPKHRITTLSIFNQLRSERGEDKELSRAYRRTVFTHTDWETHRSTSRYFRHVDGMLTCVGLIHFFLCYFFCCLYYSFTLLKQQYQHICRHPTISCLI